MELRQRLTETERQRQEVLGQYKATEEKMRVVKDEVFLTQLCCEIIFVLKFFVL